MSEYVFKRGDRVTHADYGEGVVKQIHTDKLRCWFPVAVFFKDLQGIKMFTLDGYRAGELHPSLFLVDENKEEESFADNVIKKIKSAWCGEEKAALDINDRQLFLWTDGM